ncbi:MAG: FAD-binding oxidoreductase [Chloroflexota bacterium]
MPKEPSLQFPELAASLGERYTEDIFERAFYRRDLASVPRLLETILAHTMPHAVARPQNTDEVAALVRYANAHHIPIVPRAAATTVYWNTVPTRGGLVVDLNNLRGMISIDEEHLTATVQSATRWGELETALNQRGCAPLSYPSSAPSATIGGWVNMEGHGIGSLKYGALAQQLKRLQVVLPSGEIFQATPKSDPPLFWFLQAEGTLGIITEVELTIRAKPESIANYLITFPDLTTLQRALAALAAATPTPYNIHFSDAAHLRLLRDAGFPLPTEKPIALVTFDGSAQEVAASAQTLEKIVARGGGELLDNGLANLEWVERFASLRIKRAGPTLLGAEAWLPLNQLAHYAAALARLADTQRVPIATYGVVVAPTMATVMSVFSSDESRMINYVLDLSLTKKIYDVAFRCGGRPYGIGFWNAPYLHRAFASRELAERLARKRQLDPSNILNPDKAYRTTALLSPIFFNLGMDLLSMMRRARNPSLRRFPATPLRSAQDASRLRKVESNR